MNILKTVLIALALCSLPVIAQTLPPGIVQLKGATDGTPVGNVGDAIKVNVTNSSSGTQTANQGMPAPAASAWPIYAPSPIPVTGDFSLSGAVAQGAPGPTASPWPVAVQNFPTPVATQPVSGTVAVSNFPTPAATQPVSGTVAVSNPSTNYALETGGNLASSLAKLTSILSALGSPFQAGGVIGNSSFGISGTLPAYGATPTFNLGTLNGAATNAELVTINSTLGSPMQNSGGSVNSVQSGAWTFGRTWNLTSGADSVSAVQSGTWNLGNITGTITLPTGASTSAAQTNGTQKTQVVDGSGNVVGPVTTLSGTNYVPVVTASSSTPGARAISASFQDGSGNAQVPQVDASKYVNVDLQTNNAGLATAAMQTTLIANQTNGTQIDNANQGTPGPTASPWPVSVVAAGNLQTYSACYVGLAVPAAPTDIFYITGSATKTITVLSDQMSGTENTVAMHLFQHIVRNSADSGGSCAGARPE